MYWCEEYSQGSGSGRKWQEMAESNISWEMVVRMVEMKHNGWWLMNKGRDIDKWQVQQVLGRCIKNRNFLQVKL